MIARRSTQIYTAEAMPWQRLRRPHVLKVWSLLGENYRPAGANRMLAALRRVLREWWHSGLISTDDYQAAAGVRARRGESESRGRDLSVGEPPRHGRPRAARTVLVEARDRVVQAVR